MNGWRRAQRLQLHRGDIKHGSYLSSFFVSHVRSLVRSVLFFQINSVVAVLSLLYGFRSGAQSPRACARPPRTFPERQPPPATAACAASDFRRFAARAGPAADRADRRSAPPVHGMYAYRNGKPYRMQVSSSHGESNVGPARPAAQHAGSPPGIDLPSSRKTRRNGRNNSVTDSQCAHALALWLFCFAPSTKCARRTRRRVRCHVEVAGCPPVPRNRKRNQGGLRVASWRNIRVVADSSTNEAHADLRWHRWADWIPHRLRSCRCR